MAGDLNTAKPLDSQYSRLDNNVDQLSPHNDDFFVRPGHEFTHVVVFQGKLLNGELVGIFCDGDAATQLAVDLHHHFNFILHECGFIYSWPRRIKNFAWCALCFVVAKFLPQGVRDMWCNGVKDA